LIDEILAGKVQRFGRFQFGTCREKILGKDRFRVDFRIPDSGIWDCGEIPPPSGISESRDGRGSCKNALQNLERVGVKSQNLENKRVAAILGFVTSTAFGLLIVNCFLSWR